VFAWPVAEVWYRRDQWMKKSCCVWSPHSVDYEGYISWLWHRVVWQKFTDSRKNILPPSARLKIC
jgi:hypothetical protein